MKTKNYLKNSLAVLHASTSKAVITVSTLLGLAILSCIGPSYAAGSETDAASNQMLISLPASLDDSQHASSLPEYVVIQPTEQVTYSSETSASVAKIAVKEGSPFRSGDTLIKLDCRVQDAELKKAVAQQDVSNMAFTSAKKLRTYRSISDLEYEQAKAQKDIANAEVDKLEAIVEKCTIKAPFNGSVAKLMVHMHETVKPGDPLLKIVSTDNLDFVLQIPSSWLAWLHLDSLINVHINEIDKSVAVKVAKINPEIDSVSQTVKIFAKQTTPDPALLPGMSGQASFPDKPVQSKNQLN